MRAADGRLPTVLIIEDDAWIRSLLSDLLPVEGYTVEEATNGAAGVRLARQHQPDVVLLDLAMPEMSGVEVLHELKGDRATANIPVIVVSAYSAQLEGSDARATEAVIQKPFVVADLIAHVDQVTRCGRGRPADGQNSGGS